MEMIKKHIYVFLNLLMLLLLGLSLYFSMQSATLMPNSRMLKVTIVIIIILFFLFVFQRKIFKRIFQFLKEYSSQIFWILFFLVIIYQLVLIKILKVTPLYDSLEILSGLGNPKKLNTLWLYPTTKINYLSGYSNNQFFFFFNYGLSRFIGTSITSFKYVNIVLIDLSVLIFKKTCEIVFNSKTVGILTGLFVLFYVGAQTFFFVPYTDTYLMLPLSLALLFMILAWKKSGNVCFFYAILAGLFSAIVYLLKPSANIYIIALVLIILLNVAGFFKKSETKKKKEKRNQVLSIAIFFLTFFLSIGTFKYYVAHQDIVEINPHQSISLAYFLLIGSWGNENQKGSVNQTGRNPDHATRHGSWNPTDYRTTFSHATVNEQKKVDLKVFVERTRKRGFIGTIQFYLIKYSDVMDTGVMGFHRDGQWFYPTGNAKKGTWQYIIQQWIYPEGKFRSHFNYICQLIWIITLILSIFGLWFRRKDKLTALVSLILIGGLLFLEIFESGGTKYMIQYIPFLSLIASLGIKELYMRLVKSD